jgi:hypothetical protein
MGGFTAKQALLHTSETAIWLLTLSISLNETQAGVTLVIDED